MAQWRRLEELRKTNDKRLLERLHFNYRNARVISKIRSLCPDCVENKNWLLCEDEATAQSLFAKVLKCLEKLEQNGDLAHQLALQDERTALEDKYGSQPLEFVQEMRHYLKEERQLIDSFQQQDDERQPPPQGMAIEIIKSGIVETAKAQQVLHTNVAELVKRQEALNLETQDLWLDAAEVSEVDGRRRDTQIVQAQELFILRQDIAEQSELMAMQLVGVFDHLWVCIDDSKRTLHLHLNGLAKLPERSVEDLSEMCELAGKVLCDALALTENIHWQLNCKGEMNVDVLQRVIDTRGKLQELFTKHMTKTFIVHRPPPQIIQVAGKKSKCAFPMGVCILGAASLGVTMPKVTAELVREKDLEKALTGHKVAGVCEVMNGKDKINGKEITMEFRKKSKSTNISMLEANFTDVCLTKAELIGRARGVAHLKYFMVFNCQVSVHGTPFQIQASSPPIALVSHHGYDCDARGSHVWNAAFPTQNGKLFEEREKVPWKEVAQVLSCIFQEKTKKALDQQQLDYLGHIAFKMGSEPSDISERLISRDQLIKDYLCEPKKGQKEHPSRQFTLWKWFCACVNLIKADKGPFQHEWQEGLIHGFLSKEDAEEMLRNKDNGTFLIRFSEKTIESSTSADICGRLTVAVIATDPKTKLRDTLFLKDYLKLREITMTSLAKTLSSLEMKDTSGRLLQFLWPNRTFETYLQEHEELEDGYTPGWKTITFRHHTSKPSVEAEPRPAPCPSPSLAIVSTHPYTGKQNIIPIKEYLTTKEIHDLGIEKMLEQLELVTKNRERPCQSNHLKRPLMDVTNRGPEENDGERYNKHVRPIISIDPSMNSSSQCLLINPVTPATSPDDMSSPESPDYVDLQLLSNDVSTPGNEVLIPSQHTDEYAMDEETLLFPELLFSESSSVMINPGSNDLPEQLQELPPP